jgi:hypothetical protein
MSANAEPAWVKRPPAAYDIVACWYPEREKREPGPDLRPGLVTQVLQSPRTGLIACRIAYGTKRLKIAKRSHIDLIIQNFEHLGQLGLRMATRFDLELTVILPWGTDFFGCWTGYHSPLIGSLTEDYIKEYAYRMMLLQSAGG